uniref:Ig-like domain-containing protein n=1 Tax=Erpetoichthys calabaricus TaxID=27687 RepID=A0A8C4RTA3_ERPCA
MNFLLASFPYGFYHVSSKIFFSILLVLFVYFIYVLKFYFLTDCSDGILVEQHPSSLLLKVRDTTNLTCKHDGGSSYQFMYWYRQLSKLNEMKLIAYLSYDKVNPEEDLKGKFSLIGDSRKEGHLTMLNATAADSGTYYCSVRYAQWRRSNRCNAQNHPEQRANAHGGIKTVTIASLFRSFFIILRYIYPVK